MGPDKRRSHAMRLLVGSTGLLLLLGLGDSPFPIGTASISMEY